MQQESTVMAPLKVPMRAGQVAKQLGIGKSTWYKWVKAKLVAPGRKISTRLVIWDSCYIAEITEKMSNGEFSTAGLYTERKIDK